VRAAASRRSAPRAIAIRARGRVPACRARRHAYTVVHSDRRLRAGELYGASAMAKGQRAQKEKKKPSKAQQDAKVISSTRIEPTRVTVVPDRSKKKA
jgi:hypothetical protein